MPTGKATVGQLVSVLRKLGADYVFDTTFSADLTIMEEGTELLQRLQAVIWTTSRCLPSCCPGLGALFWKSQFRNDRPPVTAKSRSRCSARSARPGWRTISA